MRMRRAARNGSNKSRRQNIEYLVFFYFTIKCFFEYRGGGADTFLTGEKSADLCSANLSSIFEHARTQSICRLMEKQDFTKSTDLMIQATRQ